MSSEKLPEKSPSSMSASALRHSPSGMERITTVEDMFNLAGDLSKAVVARLVPTGKDMRPSIDLYARGAGADGGENSEGTIRIGRSKDIVAGYRLDCVRLSNVHIELVVSDNDKHEVTLTDRSSNGTWVNGARVEKGKPVVLRKGDAVSLLNPAHTDPLRYDYCFQQLLGAGGDLKKAASSVAVVAESGAALASCKKDAAPATTAAAAATADNEDLDDELCCSICQSIYYRPMTTVPCLHTFCAPCIAGWLDKGSTQCPECRAELNQVRPNHKIAAVVETLSKLKPELQRTATEIADLAAKDTLPKIGKMVREGKHAKTWGDEDSDYEFPDENRNNDDDDEDDDDDDASFDSEDSGLGIAVPGYAHVPHFGFGGHTPAVGPTGAAFHLMPKFFHPPPGSKCAECDAPGADGFKCPPGQFHVGCFLCKTPFPDRPNAAAPQRCDLCNTAFCDLYLGGCKNPAGEGYLQPIEDHTMEILPTGVLFGGNHVEQTVLSTYMDKAKLRIPDAWQSCLEKFRGKDWIPDITCVKGPLKPQSTVCRPCCQRVFAALLYHYRRAIPRDALPPEAAARPDCWFGRECRTQFKNPAHAQNYNHVCPQVKRKE